MVSLSGEWKVFLDKTITLPGTVNGSGLGEKTGPDTEWNSGLFNPFWYEREEYKNITGNVPFLSQPKTYYAGTAVYEREFETAGAGEWFLLIELSKWRVSVSIDDICIGVDESLCTPFCLAL